MKLLIAIHGSHSQPEQMQAQMETWLPDLQGRADSKFFLGHPRVDSEHVVSLDMPDGPIWKTYRNGPRTEVLNRKTEALAKYAFENGYDYVFKCDDDTYVNVDRLLSSGFEFYDYTGSMDRHYARDIGFYRWAQGGAGYWLSRKSMAVIAEHGLHLVEAEDFAVGQVLAHAGILPRHDSRYIAGFSMRDIEGGKLENFISLHKVNAEWMRRIHATF